MRWTIRHRTAYRYAMPVRDSFNEARVRPPTDTQQRLEEFRLTVAPAARVSHFVDFYGNAVAYFDVCDPHSALDMEVRSVVTTLPRQWLPWDARSSPLADARRAGQTERFDFSRASRFVDTDPETWRLAVDATQGQTDIWQAAVAIMRFVHDRMAYEPASTHVHTHARDALSKRRGVCQDFAHIMIGLCRSLHIPARYVSGYLATQGASATHAWTDVFIPTVGWVSVDPTHNRQPDETYIRLAAGRDYSDVPPLRGTYRGTNQHRMDVLVEIKSDNGSSSSFSASTAQ
jgi:transglutaminase-like putative cysteine protease